MGRMCAVFGCNNREKGNSGIHGDEISTLVSLHRFPLSKPQILKVWVAITGRKGWTPRKDSRICSHHFTADQFYPVYAQSSERCRALKRDAVPTISHFNSEKENVTENVKPAFPVVEPVMLPKLQSDCTASTASNKILPAFPVVKSVMLPKLQADCTASTASNKILPALPVVESVVLPELQPACTASATPNKIQNITVLESSNQTFSDKSDRSLITSYDVVISLKAQDSVSSADDIQPLTVTETLPTTIKYNTKELSTVQGKSAHTKRTTEPSTRKLQQRIAHLRKKIRTLQQNSRRKDRRIETLKELIINLKKQGQPDDLLCS